LLRQRVGTALVLAPLGLLAVLYLKPQQFWWLLAALFAVAGWEWARLVDVHNFWLRLAAALVVALGVVTGAQFAVQESTMTGAAGVLIWIIASVCLARWDLQSTRGWPGRLFKGLFGLLLLLIGAYALGALFDRPNGRYGLLLLLLLIWAADIGAYIVGRSLGQHKLAPRVSPGKTWEGVLGGVSLAIVVALIASKWMTLQAGQLWWLLAVSLATVGVSVVGDLFISLMKRQAGLKDAGRIFPGHGGVLDRFDSLIAAAPVFLLGKHLLGL
jgi:phosphatidate cytidylyltransferase